MKPSQQKPGHFFNVSLSGRPLAVLSALGIVVSTSGCAALSKAVRSVFVGPEVEFTRTAPATEDLPGITTVAVAKFGGKADDAAAIAGHLGTSLSNSGRFQVVERARLESLAQEKGCAPDEVTCVAGMLPASAIVVGDVTQSSYDEHVETDTYECEKDKKKTTCTSRTRKGSARVAANLRLVDTATGKVLYQRQINEVHSDSSYADGGDSPAALDSAAMLETGRQLVADNFFSAIAPHPVVETIELESDGDIPELERGNDLLVATEYASATQIFEAGIQRVESAKEMDNDVKGKAYYDLGVAQAILGDFEPALKNLRQATSLDPENDDWAMVLAKVSTWKGESAAVTRQLAYANAAPSTSAVAAVEPAAATEPEAVAEADTTTPTDQKGVASGAGNE